MSTESSLPAPGDLLARDGAFYTIGELQDSLDGPLVVAVIEDPEVQPQRVIIKAADLRPAGRAGSTPIWRS